MTTVIIVILAALLMVGVLLMEISGSGIIKRKGFDGSDLIGVWNGESGSVIFYSDGTFALTEEDPSGIGKRSMIGTWTDREHVLRMTVCSGGGNGEKETDLLLSCRQNRGILYIGSGSEEKCYRKQYGEMPERR